MTGSDRCCTRYRCGSRHSTERHSNAAKNLRFEFARRLVDQDRKGFLFTSLATVTMPEISQCRNGRADAGRCKSVEQISCAFRRKLLVWLSLGRLYRGRSFISAEVSKASCQPEAVSQPRRKIRRTCQCVFAYSLIWREKLTAELDEGRWYSSNPKSMPRRFLQLW